MHIVIGGQRGSGKSTLTASVYTLLRETGHSVGLHEVDVYSDTLPCILGSKPWEKRVKKKHAWFNPTIKRRIDEFASDTRRIVLGDLPGKVTNPFLPRMVEPADAAIIVARDWEHMALWEKFFTKHGIEVRERIMSCLSAPAPVPALDSSVVHVWGLNREVLRTPEVTEVARRLRLHASAHSLLAAAAA